MIARLPEPGMTSRGFARGGSYDRLAALVPAGARVLDLACGDGALLQRLCTRAPCEMNVHSAIPDGLDANCRLNVHSAIPDGLDANCRLNVHSAIADSARVVGVDADPRELRLATGVMAPAGSIIAADAHALPFADASFDIVTCHLAFMVFAEPARVVAELARVLRPGGELLAVLGGGPTAAGGDALAWFADRLPARPGGAVLTEARWAERFTGWTHAPWQRWELDLSGSLDAVCATLAASYEPFDRAALGAELRAAFPADPIPCRAVAWLARAAPQAALAGARSATRFTPRR